VKFAVCCVRSHRLPVSLRPWGARSIYWYMPPEAVHIALVDRGKAPFIYSQLSSLISFGAGAPFPVSSSDFRLSRNTAHLVLQ